MIWVPGNSNIEGLTHAVQQAGLGAILPTQQNSFPYTLEGLRRRHMCLNSDRLEEWWITTRPTRYATLGIDTAPRTPKELTLPREALSRILAARSGHGDFAEYHRRFRHDDAELTCTCGRDKSPEHFFHCSRGRRLSRALTGDPSTRIPHLLGTAEGLAKLVKWLHDLNFYKSICPRSHPLRN